jgi:hypothetical protein
MSAVLLSGVFICCYETAREQGSLQGFPRCVKQGLQSDTCSNARHAYLQHHGDELCVAHFTAVF